LDLYSSALGDTGAELLAESLKTAQVPITLVLWGNIIGEAGARLFAEAIQLARIHINLDLGYNFLGDSGVKLLAESLKVARVPLSLNLGPYHELTSNAQGDNFIIDAGTNPSEFLRQLKLSFSKKILEQKLGQVSVLAEMVQEYVGDEYLAWLEISAIRAVVGASHDNRYSSINYEMLQTAYSTLLIPDVPPVLVINESHMMHDENNEKK
jgi:hypothetical protein